MKELHGIYGEVKGVVAIGVGRYPTKEVKRVELDFLVPRSI
jgi:hypothetical protein